MKKTVKARSSAPHGDTAAEVNISPKAVSPSLRNAVFRNANGQCEYCDPVTGRRCENRHLLEIDHIGPRFLGGSNEIANLRALCRTHNLMMAERSFGREKIEVFRVKF